MFRLKKFTDSAVTSLNFISSLTLFLDLFADMASPVVSRRVSFDAEWSPLNNSSIRSSPGGSTDGSSDVGLLVTRELFFDVVKSIYGVDSPSSLSDLVVYSPDASLPSSSIFFAFILSRSKDMVFLPTSASVADFRILKFDVLFLRPFLLPSAFCLTLAALAFYFSCSIT